MPELNTEESKRAAELLGSAFSQGSAKHKAAMAIMNKMPMLRADTLVTKLQLESFHDVPTLENNMKGNLGKIVGEYVGGNCVSLEDLPNGDKKAEVRVFILSEAQVLEYLLAAIDAPKNG